MILPDGSVLTSVSGIIDTTWSGVAGDITLVIPKVTSEFSISESNFIGKLETKATYIYASDCTSLTSISAPKAITLGCSNCPSLTSTVLYSILDNAYSLFLKGQLTGELFMVGTTPEINELLTSSVHGIQYLAMITAMTDWAITCNSINS